MICPSVPGGTTDLAARIVAQKLSEDWKQQVVVDNRGGASGVIGSEMAARAAPDGYTLLLGTMSTHAVNPAFSKHVITSPKRSAALPELPSVAESGVPGFDVQVWFGVFMPAGAPRPIVNTVNERIKKMLEGTELRKRLIDQGADPASSTPEEFGALVKADLARWTKVVKATGVASAER